MTVTVAAPPATPVSSTAAAAPLRTSVLLTLSLLAAIAPLATDLYLPAFPAMTDDLQTSATGIQLSLTAFLAGAGIGQVIFGPLSDRVGRRGPVLVGLTVCVLASVATALAPTVAFLVAARVVQGLSGAAGMVIGRAMISDTAAGHQAARALSLMMVVGGIAPVVAPVAGSLLVEPLGWRGLLWVVAALAAIALVAGIALLRETRPATPRRAPATRTGVPLRSLTSRRYLGSTFAVGFAFATMMAYISASPFIYQNVLGLTTIQYGIAFGLNALALAGMSLLSNRLTRHTGLHRLARIGLAINAVSIVAITVIAVSGDALVLLIPLMALAVGALGLVLGNVTALALDAIRESAGTGSAVLGLLQFGLAALVAPLVGIAGESTAIPMALVMLGASLLANLSFALVRRGGAAASALPDDLRDEEAEPRHLDGLARARQPDGAERRI